LRLSFIGTLRRVIRRVLPKLQRLQPQEIPFFKLVKLENLNANFYRKGFIKKPKSGKKACFKIYLQKT
jgi:hypothetical protein